MRLLTKRQKLVLNTIIEQCPYGTVFKEDMLANKFWKTNTPIAEPAAICASLEHIGYIKNLHIGAGGLPDRLELTYEGRNYKEIERLSFLQFFIERLVIFVLGIIGGLVIARLGQ